MSLSIDALLSVPTEDEFKQRIYDNAVALGLSTTSWQPGSPVRTIIAIAASQLHQTAELMLVAIQGGFLDDAVEGWLTLVAKLIYDVDRIEATFATGDVTMTNAGGGVYVLNPGDVTFKDTASGETYINTTGFTLNALSTITVPVRANNIGSEANAAPGQIDDLVTTLLGVTVSNALAVVGEDAETDAALRQRCRESLGALSPNGPKAAYEYVATTPALNGGVAVTRVKVLPPPGDGTITVVIAGPDGALSGGDVSLVQAGIDANAVPETVTATVESASNVEVSPTLDVYVSNQSGLSSGEVETLVDDGLLAYIPTLPIGGVLLQGGPNRGVSWRALEGIVEDQSPFILQAVLSPETDIVLAATEVARIEVFDIDVTVHFVAP